MLELEASHVIQGARLNRRMRPEHLMAWSALSLLCIFARNQIPAKTYFSLNYIKYLTSGLFNLFFRRRLRHQAGRLQIQRRL